MTPLDFFSDRADLYAIARPTYPPELFSYLASLCPDQDFAWDCATGNGQAAQALTQHFRQVEATDLSSEQLSQAKPHPQIRYSVQLAEETTFADNSFSLITVAQALHWFNFEQFWPEVQRLLKPDGIFAAWSYGFPELEPQLDAILQTQLLDLLKPYWAPQNQLAIDGYQTIALPLQELKTPAFFLAPQWNLPQVLAYFQTWSATKKAISQQGETFWKQFATAFERAWGDVSTPKKIPMNMNLRIAQAAELT